MIKYYIVFAAVKSPVKEKGDSQTKTLNHLPRVADGEFMELQHVHDAALVKTTVQKEYIQTCTDTMLGLSHLRES